MKRVLSVACAATIAIVTPDIANAQSFGNYYSFGDSLSDNGRTLRETGHDPTISVGTMFGGPGFYEEGRWSNKLNFTEILPRLVGASYTADHGFAIGGSRSVHLPPNPNLSPNFAWGLPDQIDQFEARFGRFGSHDLINLWIGYNDLSGIPAAATPAQANAAITTIVGNTTNSLERMASLGGRQFVVFNQHTYRPLFGGSANAAALNGMLLDALTPLSASGLNIHYFDINALVERLRADPAAYGFLPNAGTVSCNMDPACAANGYTTGLENQYIFPEGIHLTGRANAIVAEFLANQLNAPFTMPIQADIAQSAALSLVGSLQGRLDARRNIGFGTTPSGPAFPESASPWTVFAMGTYARPSETQFATASRDESLGAGTIGVEYRWGRNLLAGGAFTYAGSDADLALQNTHTSLESYQFSGFAAANYANWFADLTLSYGVNDYDTERDTAGVGSLGTRLTASPNGDHFVVAPRIGYLFDTPMLRLGPIAGLTYGHVSIDGYTESGDPLLTQAVGEQTLEGWVASLGLQFRLPAGLAPGFTPFFNLTAEHEFGGNARFITTAQTYALNLPIVTELPDSYSDTYGKAAGGVLIDLGTGFSANINAESTFARDGGNVFAITAGINVGL